MSEVFGFEFVDFEFKGDEALEFAVVEEEVDEEVAVADLETVFLTEEGEVASEFEDEVAEAADEGGFEVAFGVVGGEVEEIEDVAIAEDACEVLGLGRWGEFDVGELGALEDAGVDLAVEFAGAVVFCGGELEVEVAFFWGFAAGDEDVMMSPA